jgi:alanine dehydrogenase
MRGWGVRFPDAEYVEAGATVLASAAEVWQRSDLIVKVKEPQPAEYAFFRPGLILFHLPASCAAAGIDPRVVEGARECGGV